MQTLVEIDIQFKTGLRPSAAHEAGDAIATVGEIIYNGKSFDPMGVPENAFQEAWRAKPTKEFNNFRKSINKHFTKIAFPSDGLPKLDFVVIDLKNFDEFDPTLRSKIMDYLSGSAAFEPKFQYPELANSKNLIIIN